MDSSHDTSPLLKKHFFLKRSENEIKTIDLFIFESSSNFFLIKNRSRASPPNRANYPSPLGFILIFLLFEFPSLPEFRSQISSISPRFSNFVPIFGFHPNFRISPRVSDFAPIFGFRTDFRISPNFLFSKDQRMRTRHNLVHGLRVLQSIPAHFCGKQKQINTIKHRFGMMI